MAAMAAARLPLRTRTLTSLLMLQTPPVERAPLLQAVLAVPQQQLGLRQACERLHLPGMAFAALRLQLLLLALQQLAAAPVWAAASRIWMWMMMGRPSPAPRGTTTMLRAAMMMTAMTTQGTAGVPAECGGQAQGPNAALKPLLASEPPPLLPQQGTLKALMWLLRVLLRRPW